MVGGNNYRKSQFNLAVQGVRQPGSAFKPFVLATALRQGISPATHFESKPQTINLGDKYWVVGNYDDSYLGSIDLERATIESDNAVYAQLTQLVGSKHVAETAKRMGIRSKLDGYFAIGLGAEAVNPLELARAYATLALRRSPRRRQHLREQAARDRGGRRSDGKKRSTRRRRSTRSAPRRRGSSTRSCRRPCGSAPASAPLSPNRPVAGKTGTTENYGDAWFVGYTPQLVVAVWVGYPTTLKPMLTEFNGEAVTGGSFPALIWKSFVEKALKGVPAAGLPLSEHAVRGAEARRPARRPAAARQRALPLPPGDRLLRRQGPDADRELPRERGRGARRAPADARRGADHASRRSR